MDRPWKDVATIARQRRADLGRSQQGVVDKAVEALGPKALSEPSVRVFESAGRESYRPQTLTAISVGLDWPPDAVARLRSGADPTDLTTPAAGAPPWEKLLDSQRKLTEAVERLADRFDR